MSGAAIDRIRGYIASDDVILHARHLLGEAQRQYRFARDDQAVLQSRVSELEAQIRAGEEHGGTRKNKIQVLRESYNSTLLCATRMGLLEREPQKSKLRHMLEDIRRAEEAYDASVPGLSDARRDYEVAKSQLGGSTKLRGEARAAYCGLLWIATQAPAPMRERETAARQAGVALEQDPLTLARQQLARAAPHPVLSSKPKGVHSTPPAIIKNAKSSPVSKIMEKPSIPRTAWPAQRQTEFGEKLLAALVQQDPTAIAAAVRIRWNGRESLRNYFTRLGFQIVDWRWKAGCLWIISSAAEFGPYRQDLHENGVAFHFASHGGTATSGRPGWWTKSTR